MFRYCLILPLSAICILPVQGQVEVNRPVQFISSSPLERQVWGLAPPVASDALVSANALRDHLCYAAAAGSPNVLLLTLDPAPDDYTEGMVVYFRVAGSSTGALTIAINSLGPRDLFLPDGATATGGELVSGTVYKAVYADGAFRLAR